MAARALRATRAGSLVGEKALAIDSLVHIGLAKACSSDDDYLINYTDWLVVNWLIKVYFVINCQLITVMPVARHTKLLR